MSAMHPIVNLDQLEVSREVTHGDAFAATLSDVGGRIGARTIGFNVTRVAAGKRAFPFHNHHVGEELFYVLEGRGTLRFGAETHPVRAGDFVACPPGGPEVAHQFIAAADCKLVYIAVSTRVDTDVWEYPDSRKWGVMAGRQWQPGDPRPKAVSFDARFVADGTGVDYWDDE